MRRSFAPSQLHRQRDAPVKSTSNSTYKENQTDDMVTIERLPLFGFLEVPQELSKQFKIPSGCIVTEKSIALRKIKRLGGPKQFHIVRPGDYANTLVKHTGFSPDDKTEDDSGAEDLPTAISNLPPFEPLVLWSHSDDLENKVEVIPQLACKLRPHQREGVQFLFECTMGLRGFEGEGCILADDMGLGKTLMSITLLWTLLNQGFSRAPGTSAVRKVIVVCPTSLVGNWDNEIRKWVGEHCPTFAVKTEPKKMIRTFLQHRGKGVLIVSYETQRLYSKLFENAAKAQFPPRNTANGKAAIVQQVECGPVAATTESDGRAVLNSEATATVGGVNSSRMPLAVLGHSNNGICDLMICDEAHKLKNADSGLARSLSLLPARKRILLSGTPMQNELSEFFNMVNFCNPGVLGSNSDFKKRYERPILAAREPDASDRQTAEAARLQKELSTIVNEFILKRGNILNAQHLPPKLVQFVCCRLTPLQETLYQHLLNSKEIRHAREGKQLDTLGAIRQLINICSHPKLLLDTYQAKRACNEPVSDELQSLVDLIHAHTAQHGAGCSGGGGGAAAGGMKPSGGPTRLGLNNPNKMSEMRNFSLKKVGGSSSSGAGERFDPELSGKMLVLSRMMQTMRACKQGERIVIVSNYTQTLDLIQQMCEQACYPVLRLDGSISANKRTKLVDDFNSPTSGAFAFLLSSKAGGCGINLIGGNRLVLFDPDWNPASDKQAAGRIWREGQKRRCFIYRFMSTGSIEEKIIQRQLSKEGLADIVDDREQVNQFSTDDLRDLFSLRGDTASDTHDTLRCKRCNSVKVKEASKKGGKMAVFTLTQAEGCVRFLEDFEDFLRREARSHLQRQQSLAGAESTASSSGDIVLPCSAEIEQLKESLRSLSFPSLPVYSRAQRDAMQGIEVALQQARVFKPREVVAHREAAGTAEVEAASDALSEEEVAEATMYAAYQQLFPASFSVFTEFLNRWVEAVPQLTLLGKGDVKLLTDGPSGGEGEEDVPLEGEFVEQEGCPEDTDFNRWSHHCSVSSCDDDVLQRALADDAGTVSFVFGLEVNWSLLEAREAAGREETEARREQQRLDLEALNEQRRLKREGLLEPVAVGSKKGKKQGDQDGSDSDSSSCSGAGRKSADIQGANKKKPSKKEKGGKRKEIEPGCEVGPVKKAKKAPKAAQNKAADAAQPLVSSATPASSSSRNPASTPQPSRRHHVATSVDPLREIDETFRADWEFLRRAHEKGKIPTFSEFPIILKQLKIFNNNWRIVPADYSSLDAAVMWTRMPGLKWESRGGYRCGFDYFESERQLRDFIFAQARLLGDAHLLGDVLSDTSSSNDTEAEQVPSIAAAAPGTSAGSSKRRRIADSGSPESLPAERSALPARSPLARVALDDINFSGSSDNDSSSDPFDVASSAPVSHSKAPARAAGNATRRRVIVDSSSDDDDGKSGEGATALGSAAAVRTGAGSEEEGVLVLSQCSLSAVQNSRPPLSATSAKRDDKRSPAARTRVGAGGKVAGPAADAAVRAVFDLTSPAVHSAAFAGKHKSPSSKCSPRPDAAATATENAHPNLRAADKACSSAAKTGPSKTTDCCSQQSSSSSQCNGSSSGGDEHSGQDSRMVGVWACAHCTLENSAATHPKHCALCGNRRSFNPRPKRAAATQHSC